ncbi:VWA domain-containing protein [Paenibacillus sp. ACRRX]|uniref:vWA domain-containing protein n=1 Tax=Paenibacillus sp. ACRRX TaxID=2918206 RepID=UPI001EF6AA57|nr:VWA domain-containing protein [Paenibacillus sp. ACRRX]MCG7410097.1 VWA domain-containing protein [Paenibacillus sp. ACRRX]
MLRRNVLNYTIWLMIGLLLLPLAANLPVASAAQQSSKLDSVLVVDVSNSMSTSDANKVGNEAMKLFIDMLSTAGDKVGIVAYTDKIEREKALLEIQSDADKQDLKQFIDQLNRGAYTDIAVGVKEAVKVLQHGADPGHEPMIVLLADGNNYLNAKGSRTQAQSDKELNEAVVEATKKGIPIYTIGLNADGKLNKEALAGLSKQTGGKSFVTSTADDLPQILSEIFASHLKLKIVPIQSITANGSYQDVTVNVPNANVMEANISIMSAKPVDVKLIDPSGNQVAIPSDEVQLSRSKSYSLMKLLQPAQGDWKLQVKGVAQDKIDINLVFNYDLELALEPIATKKYEKGDTVDINAYLVSNGQKLQNSALYKNMKAVLSVTDHDTGNVKEIPLQNKGDRFEGSYKIEDKHIYELKVKAEEKSFFRETKPVTVDAKSNGLSGSKPDAAEEKPLSIWLIILGIAALLGAATGAYFIVAAVKKANKGFVGQLVIEIRDENTGEKSYPQYKKLAAFKGKFTLHQVLQLAPELKETEKLIFVPARNDRILVKSGSAGTIEKSGRAVDASGGMELKNGDRITVPLQSVDKTILIEYLV